MLFSIASAGGAHAGIWATDPVFGLQGDYSSNPQLVAGVGQMREAHAAVLVDLPTTYRADDLSLTLQPSVRVANSQGYSSLASDYAHLNAAGTFITDRDSFTSTLQFDRDSSLYHDYLLSGSTGVRRDTTVQDLVWTRALTQRTSFSVEADSSGVQYGRSTSVQTLTNYRYSVAQPSVSWTLSERNVLSLQGAIGIYQSGDDSTRSSNDNLQLGLSRQLDETWNVSASAGLSHESNRVSQGVPVFQEIDGELYETLAYRTFRSSQNGSVFLATLSRQTERLQLTATASRSLSPSGFALLSILESYQAGFHFPHTERWSFDGNVRRVKSLEPQIVGPSISQTYVSAALSTTWLATEKWSVTLAASWVAARYIQPTAVDVNATGATLNVARHFNTLKWN